MNHWDGHFPVRRKLSLGRNLFAGKEAVYWEEGFPVARKFFSEKGTPTGKRFTVGREPSVGRKLSNRKRAFK